LIEGDEITHLEWLGVVPSSKATKGLEEQTEKVGFLKELGAARLVLPNLPLAGLEHFARRVTSRKPAALTRIKDPHRTIEIACFLRLEMLRLTDASLTLLDHRIAALWRGAREHAEDARESRLRRFRELLGDLAGLAGNEALDATELRSGLQALVARFEPERDATQVSAIRQELGRKSPSTISSPRLLRRSTRWHRRPPPPCRMGTPAIRRIVAGLDRPAGPGGGARLLSRGDLNGAQAGAAEPIGVGRAQPLISGARGSADPAETLAARPQAFHPRPELTSQRGGLSAAA